MTTPISPTHYNEPRMREAYQEGYRVAKAEDAALLEAAKAALTAIEPMCMPTAGIALHTQRDQLRAAIAAAEKRPA